MIEWREDVGYMGTQAVAFISNHKRTGALILKVRGGNASDNYYVEVSFRPISSAAISAAKGASEIVYRIAKNHSDQDSAQAALRAYSRIKGEGWWEEA